MLALVYSFFIYKRKPEIVTMLLIRLKESGTTHSQRLGQSLATDSSSDCHFLDSARLVFPH